MSDLFQIGLSGVYSAQANLSTTGHNIANINTEGYSRQTVDISTAGSDKYGNSFIGRGSIIAGIERAYDQFAFNESIMNTSHNAQAQELYTQRNQVDQLLSNEYTSATKPVLDFFSSMNSVASNPSVIEARTSMIESAQNMVSQYNRLYDNLDSQYSMINHEIEESAKVLTSLGDDLAMLNQQISAASERNGNGSNSDLLDQRDLILQKMSEFSDISVVPASNNMINVYIGSGQALVMGSEALNLTAVNGEPDPSRKELALNINGEFVQIDGNSLGGKFSALFSTRKDDLERAINQLGQNIMGLTQAINDQQKLGQTLDGSIGVNLFSDINAPERMQERVIGHDDGLSNDVSLTLRIDDIGMLSADEYELKVTSYTVGGLIEFEVKNQSTGNIQTISQDTSVSKRIEIPKTGVSLGLNNITNLEEGKSFTLRPTRLGAKKASIDFTDPKLVAVAKAEIEVLVTSGNTGTSKLAVTNISNKLDTLYMDKESSITLKVTGVTNGVITYELQDKDGAVFTLPAGASLSPLSVGDPVSGLTLSIDPLSGKAPLQFAGIEIDFTGMPMVGDSFTFQFNETGAGDNRNLLEMTELQNKKLMNDSKATFQDIYSSMIAEVGSKTANADIAAQSSAVLKQQAFERVQNVAGVNMDEEAANLLQYQQHYSAAARVITVANELFDTILQASR
jgi:flagellar hook-associated protein 1 FlgK